MSAHPGPESRPSRIRPDRRRRRGATRPRASVPRIEWLEDRVVLSTDTWTGLGQTNLWQDGGNWASHSAPQPGDDLLFPQLDGAAPFITVNDFASGTAFGSITIAGSGYELLGNQVHLTGGSR